MRNICYIFSHNFCVIFNFFLEGGMLFLRQPSYIIFDTDLDWLIKMKIIDQESSEQ